MFNSNMVNSKFHLIRIYIGFFEVCCNSCNSKLFIEISCNLNTLNLNLQRKLNE